MNTKIEEIDGKFIATLAGEMDTAAAMEAEEVLKPLYTSNGKDVIIDCTELEYIASNDDIKNVFKLTGFISIFEFE